MFFDESTSIDTPEGVALELTLAGVGSRIWAQVLDSLIKLVAILVVFVAVAGAFDQLAIAITIVIVITLGYDIALETRMNGQTPGKRAAKIRVVMEDGSPVTFRTVVVRNLLRLVDALPTAYGVGLVLVFTTKKAQRLGDLAAGTIVVKERLPYCSPPGILTGQITIPPGFDATRVTQEQVAVARNFLTRRYAIPMEHRDRIAAQVEANLRGSIVDPTGELQGERLIEVVVAAKTDAADSS